MRNGEGISWGRCRMHYSDLISRSSASTSRIRRGSRHAISQEIEVESWKNKRVLRCPQPCPATTTVLPSARPLSDDPPPSLANGKTQPRRGGLGFLIRPYHGMSRRYREVHADFHRHFRGIDRDRKGKDGGHQRLQADLD